MPTGPQARIVSYNQEGEAACASAARISTTQGSAEEIFAAARDSGKNRPLIAKVLRSGHKSTLEHAVFTIALSNVSVFVEQFFIEARLASFTVKSRRYVDFGGLGYYIPPELEGGDRAAYCRYMDALFGAYRELLELGVPKEDARFLLPYSFHSSFYCTVNARELGHILRQIRLGRGRGVPELQSVAEQLAGQLADLFPSLLPELEGEADGPVPTQDTLDRVEDALLPQREAGRVELLSAPAEPLTLLRAAHRAACPLEEGWPGPEALLRSQRPRELEQLTYTFRISDVTLAGVTHIVRHRMQSAVVPPVQSVLHGRYILPASIEADGRALEVYTRALEEARTALRRMRELPALRRYGYYCALSGCMMDLMTTMNARELQHFIRLRTCTRAQWEVRGIALAALRQLRGTCPDLFRHYGPSCFLLGRCPEGAMSCGRMEEMGRAFGGELL